MKFINKYFNSEWSATKIKVEEKLKTVAFDAKNHRLVIMTHESCLLYTSDAADE